MYFVSQAIDASVDADCVHGCPWDASPSSTARSYASGAISARPISAGGLLSSFVEPEHAQVSMSVCSNWTGEALGIASNGFRFPIAGSITRIDDPAGGLAGFVASFRDVSDRARAEQALRESEERYRSLVEFARDTIFTADATGRFLYVNNAAADHPRADAGPGDRAARWTSCFRPTWPSAIAAASARHRDRRDAEYRRGSRDVDGQVRWFSTIVQPMTDAQGQRVAAQAIVRDITTRKLAEERLMLSEERLNQAIRVADIGFFDHDHVKGERYWSPELRQIAGLQPDDPLPPHPSTHPASAVWWMHPDDRPMIVDAVKRAHAPQGDGFYDVEYRFIRPNGVTRWLKGALADLLSRRRRRAASGAHGGRCAGHHRSKDRGGRSRPPAGPADTGAEDGVGRSPGRGGRARLQQHAQRHQRPRRTGVARGKRRRDGEGRPRRDSHRGAARRRPDATTPGLCPSSGRGAENTRPE
jgi:PAS domain-containing protein